MRFIFLLAATVLITAQHRQTAGSIMQRAYNRLGWRPSEVAATANMTQAEVTRQLSGEHHIWLDAAVAQGPLALAEVGFACLEASGLLPPERDLKLQAASEARKRMAIVESDNTLVKEA